jgi:hypothetical protein
MSPNLHQFGSDLFYFRNKFNHQSVFIQCNDRKFVEGKQRSCSIVSLLQIMQCCQTHSWIFNVNNMKDDVIFN